MSTAGFSPDCEESESTNQAIIDHLQGITFPDSNAAMHDVGIPATLVLVKTLFLPADPVYDSLSVNEAVQLLYADPMFETEQRAAKADLLAMITNTDPQLGGRAAGFYSVTTMSGLMHSMTFTHEVIISVVTFMYNHLTQEFFNRADWPQLESDAQ